MNKQSQDLGSPVQESKKIIKAAGLLGVLTFFSRILGLARDIGQAAILGTGMAADAFTIAFIIPNILRRLAITYLRATFSSEMQVVEYLDRDRFRY